VFYIPNEIPSVYALDNWDPLGEAFVLSRGIIGDIQDELCVASPLYKQHFALTDGRCLDAPGIAVKNWPVEVRGEEVWLKAE
jgi:nitrite reductase (NADH) small subunit